MLNKGEQVAFNATDSAFRHSGGTYQIAFAMEEPASQDKQEPKMNIFKAMRLQREKEKQEGGETWRMERYEGSVEYQEMIKRNGGTAPGGSSLGSMEHRGPKGGKYSIKKRSDGTTYRRYF